MIRSRPYTSIVSCLLALLLSGVLGIAPALAQEGDEIQTAEYDVQNLSYPELRDFDVPEPERMELDNGMTVFLLEDRELPKVQAVARVGTGSVFEPAEKRGLASITGGVMRTGGTSSMSPDSMNTVLENVGATVETSIGETSGTAYMSALSDNVDTVLPVLADVIRNPSFAEEKIQQRKSRVRSSISRRNDNARRVAFRELDKLVYGADSPYARTPEYYTVSRVERQDLVDFHEKYFKPSNVYLSVWGDFDAETMKEKIRGQFGDWPAADDFDPPTPPEPTTNREYSVNFIQKDDVTQSTIVMGHPGTLTRDDPDYAPVTIMNEVLSGGFSSRLFQSVRKEKGLAYSVFGGYSANYNRPGRFRAGVFTKSSTTVEATNAVMTEVKRMREEAPTDEELGLAKDSYLNSFVFNFDTKREIINRLMTYEYYGYPQDFLQQTREEIEDVTAADVKEVANEYLYPEASHVLIVGKREDFSESLSTLTTDGSVNEIDISIPKTPPGEEDEAMAASEEQKAKGMSALKAVKEELGGERYAQVRSMSVEGTQTRTMKGKEISIDLTVMRQMPDQYRIVQGTPMGEVVITMDGDEGKMKTPRGTKPMPSSQMKQFKGQLWRDMTFLMTHLDADGLEAVHQGMETVEETEYEAVQISPPTGDAFTLLLDPETKRPERMTYTAQTRQGPKEAMDVFDNYKTVSGISIPHKQVTYQDGDQSSSTSYSSVTINPDLEDDLFTLSQESEE